MLSIIRHWNSLQQELTKSTKALKSYLEKYYGVPIKPVFSMNNGLEKINYTECVLTTI